MIPVVIAMGAATKQDYSPLAENLRFSCALPHHIAKKNIAPLRWSNDKKYKKLSAVLSFFGFIVLRWFFLLWI
ncbi:hypothetical protein EG346_16380 [Chryseobacterium carnipullorum]|uniref:Uncharacterized protein n=1 Tax=Chryseobacterium carnipullorum TaxID=1124835 RepID=A0A376DT84_CHRCU|nr:hypothetical protein EG346_16380 [Chryseobacterium carnipullorum]AZA64552.1 hypothetical protein EG345_07400 [Chryseobacterium carnipullorum]STC95153.1 Uncharacterised protein [Chryseobacterium carnipullorum]